MASDDGGPEATALWNEIGLIGDEIKTAQPLLSPGIRLTTTISATPGIWGKTLASGYQRDDPDRGERSVL